MKTSRIKFFTLAVALTVTMLTSCSDDDDKKTTTYNPLTDYLEAAGFVLESTAVDEGDYEFGFSFRTAVDGVIKAVVVKLPDDEATVRVTLWDAETETILRTVSVTSVVTDVAKTVTIEELAIEADHDYMITFNSDDWYNYAREDGEAVTYPITVGNISVLSYSYYSGSEQMFPDSPQDDYYAGDVSFIFESVK